jgi:HD superfamily phosphohydrolase
MPEVASTIERAAGEEVTASGVARILTGRGAETERLLAQIVSGELDVDKMDYLLRDSLYCGVRYGTYDLDRLLDTMLPLEDPATGGWGIGVEEGGVHALEALVMARYYMFTQVYFNVTGKALELHLNHWLQESGGRWACEPETFLAQDDISVWAAMRQSASVHARAVVAREHFPVAFETREHLPREDKERFEALLPEIAARFGEGNLLVSRSAKDPHRMGRSRVLVRRYDGSLEPMEEASHFIRHLTRIDRYRVYAPPSLHESVAAAFRERWGLA